MFFIKRFFSNIDWTLCLSLIPLLGAGLVTMSSFSGQNYFFERQLIWIGVCFTILITFSQIDWRFLRRSEVVTGLYFFILIILSLLFFVGQIKGAQSWFSVGGVSFQPVDFAKLVLIIVLAKYFSRRHVEIANIRHIIMSGIYTFIPFALILVQPDFGSGMIIFLIWLGMIVISGVSKKHLFIVATLMIAAFSVAWLFVFAPYQKARILTFIHPLADIRGAGYNAFQSQVAVGSGQIFGKGVGYGTQSRLSFLPEYETDFIFAAFAEEWGFVGVVILFLLFGLVIWRIVENSRVGATNFETLFALGLAIMFMSHFVIHVGMNVGLLPVTGLPLPFLSYGGSHLLGEFAGLGILMGMRRYRLAYHRDDMKNEFLGPQ
jgi:rod shape determining protein RodA